jgi:hypothetical protein
MLVPVAILYLLLPIRIDADNPAVVVVKNRNAASLGGFDVIS